MIRLKLIRITLVITVLMSAIWTVPTSSVSACSCVASAAADQLESHRQAAIVRAIGTVDDKLIFEVSKSYGVQMPEQISVAPSQCDPGGLFDHDYGFSVYSAGGDWHFATCSGVPASEMAEMVGTLDLQSFDPLQSAIKLRFGDLGSDEVEVQSAGVDHTLIPASTGFKAEWGITFGVLMLILLLMTARTRGWGPIPK